MTRKTLLSAASLLALACAAERPALKPAPPAAAAAQAPAPAITPDAEFRAHKPPPAAVEPRFQAPVPAEARLANGARLLVIENHAVPLVSIGVLVESGVDAEPAGKGGIASFTASMLTEGTKSLPAQAFAARVEDLAARLGASAELEATRVHLNCLTETLPQALDLLADALVNPAFRPEDVERVRGLLLTGLVQKKASLQALARDAAARILSGADHPWGRPAGGTPETVKSITRADLARFHHQLYRPNHAIVSVSGDTTLAEMKKLLDAKRAGWKRRALPPLRLPPLPAIERRSVTIVDKPGSPQSQIWVVGRLFPASSPDRVPFLVANNILGGLFGSRLNQNLREEKGYSYGVFSGARLGRTTGSFTAAGGIQAPSTAEALAEFEKELTAFSGGALREGELQRAKEALIRSLPARLETNDAVSGAIAGLALDGMPLDYDRQVPGLVARVDAAEVARVARTWIHPERMPVVVVGPRSEWDGKIRAMNLGPVEVRSAQ